MPERSPKSRRFALLRRRPSASMIVALVALFLSAGGASYAAVTLPAGSVGSTQLKNKSVTNSKVANNAIGFRKIIPNSIGVARVNKNAVQLRVRGNCTKTANQAITSVMNTGSVTCGNTLPPEYDSSTAAPVTIPSSTVGTTIAALPLSGSGSFLVMANPYVEVSSTNKTSQHIVVQCALSAGVNGALTQTRQVSFNLNSNEETAEASIPLSLTVPTAGTSANASVACIRTITPNSAATARVSVTINAIQTASNTTSPPITVTPAPADPTPPPTPATTTTTTSAG